MTVVSQTTRKRYTGTATPAEEYPVTFTFDYAADLQVIHTDSSATDTTLTLDTHYTVSGGSGSTGTVTVTDSDYRAGTGEYLTILLDLDIEQQTDLVDNAALSASVLETQFDRNVRIMQQLQEQIDRSVKVGATSGTDPDDLVDIIESSVTSCAADAAAASSSASSASDSADAAAASAASVDLPTLVANRMLVANDTPEWELQSFDEVLTTLGGGDFGIDMFKATTSSAGATLFGLGSGAYANTGSGAGELVALLSGAKIPAYDGSLLTGIPHSYKLVRETFLSNASWTAPVTCARVICIGAGGDGGDGNWSSTIGGGGGGGGYAEKDYTNLVVDSSYTVSISSGIASFNSEVTANPGSDGTAQTVPTNGGAGGTATGGDINIPGTQGGFTNGSDLVKHSGCGGDAGGRFGGSGAEPVANTGNGLDGQDFGGGASGGSSGGTGGKAVVIIEYVLPV